MAFVTSLEGQTVLSLSVYATSAFKEHSLISIVLVVPGVVNGTYLYLCELRDGWADTSQP